MVSGSERGFTERVFHPLGVLHDYNNVLHDYNILRQRRHMLCDHERSQTVSITLSNQDTYSTYEWIHRHFHDSTEGRLTRNCKLQVTSMDVY